MNSELIPQAVTDEELNAYVGGYRRRGAAISQDMNRGLRGVNGPFLYAGSTRHFD